MKPAQEVPSPRPELGIEGVVPMPARREPWMEELLEDHAQLEELIREHGSPLNLINPGLLADHAAELIDAAQCHGVDLRVYFARKTNKSLALVEAALSAGHGIDVASERELAQVLSRLGAAGATPDQVIVTAAVKPAALLTAAMESGAVICLDNTDEVELLLELAEERETASPVSVALRLQPVLAGVEPSRFGMSSAEIRTLLGSPEVWGRLRLVGLHFHLDGYDGGERAVALVQALTLVSDARNLGHTPAFVDMGGGIPIRYLDDPRPWKEFWERHRGSDRMTWRNRVVGKAYPAWQSPIRGEWLDDLLARAVDGSTVAEQVRDAGVALHCEPGRALADGCGMTIARVEFRKQLPDRTWLIGLAMNRTQCRSAADDFLIDPVLVKRRGRERSLPGEGFLVGAYCVEAELLTWRRLRFPDGVAVGDMVAFINTGGYQMHILESASHQIPLARNVVRRSGGGPWELDPIDHPPSPTHS